MNNLNFTLVEISNWQIKSNESKVKLPTLQRGFVWKAKQIEDLWDSLLRGLDKRIAQKTKLTVHVAEDTLRAVARGTGIALKNFDKFTFLIK